jgi:hypothetical protein
MLNQDKTHKPQLQSRRYVQRRFSPGTLFVYGKNGGRLGTIIGWAPVAANINPANGYVRSAASWEVLVLSGESRIERLSWATIREWLTVEEWEELD